MLASVYRISWTLLITFRDTLLADARPLKPTSFFKTGSYGIFRSSAKRLDFATTDDRLAIRRVSCRATGAQPRHVSSLLLPQASPWSFQRRRDRLRVDT